MIKEAKQSLRTAIQETTKANSIVKGIVREGRLLLSEEDLTEFKGLALIVATLGDNIQTHLHEFERMTVGSKRFAVQKTK